MAHRWYVLTTPALMQPALQAQWAAHIAVSEEQHEGQIAVYVERELPAHYISADRTARDRAVGLFGKLGVWDTEYNNGVLIYLLEAEHAIEIVADRGVRTCTQEADWTAIAQQLAQLLQAGQTSQGMLLAVDSVGALLAAHFPRATDNTADAPRALDNEVPDFPVL
ncbi:TPM domain-containing protein [Lampropedia puyangensis]|uniref:TPM domain-containing protein n=1 Tax=Lampropedia puyangensis TaxID=1330072 RepID=UPI001305144A|nr:TPM domain-containing protein [Lampropedia puyangensis]